MAAVEVVALEDMCREQPQLAGGPAALAVQAGLGQAGFLGADLGDGSGARLDLIDDGIEELRAVGAGGGGIGREAGGGGFAGLIDQIGGADGEVM